MRLLLAILVLAGTISGVASAQTPAPSTPPVTVENVRQYLVGTWQSDADTRFTRELDANGKAFDRLLGEERDSIPGTWAIFLGGAPPPRLAALKFDPKAVYLEIDQDGDLLLFQLVQISRADVQMVYLQQNKLMAFSRLK